MGEHLNASRVRELFDAFANGDAVTIREIIPEEAVWHFPGRRGKLAGTHRGRNAILGFFVSVRELSGGTFHLDLIDVLASDQGAVALFRGHAARADKTLDNLTALHLRMNDGQVVEVHEFVWDAYAVDEFWS